MAAVTVADHKTGVGAPTSIGRDMYVVTYDFSVDGGASADTYDLLTFQDALAIRLVACRVRTAVSGTSSTISLGVAGGSEMFSTVAEATFAEGAIVNQGDAGEFYKVEDGEKVSMAIGTADLTAGKLEFLFETIKA